MPALPDASHVLKVEFIGTYSTAGWANIIHVSFSTGTPTVADLNTYASAMATLYHDSFLTSLHTNCVLKEVVVTDLTTHSSAVGRWDGTLAGTGTGTAMSAATALVLSWKISRRYRGGHPRTYLIGLETANQADTKSWSGATVTEFQEDGQDFLDGVALIAVTGSVFGELVSLSYFSAHAVRVTPVVDVIQAVAVHSRIDTQRRRLGKETT